MNRLFAEVVGTFCLVFAGCGAMVVNGVHDGAISHVGVAITWGTIVMAMIYALGEVSGAHLNPAVTLGFAVAKRFAWAKVPGYIAAQCLGAILGATLLRVLFLDWHDLGMTLPQGPVWQTWVLEVFLTFMLMFVILCVATGSKEQGLMAGIAVGGVVGLEAMFAGPVCRASMNPARSLGPALLSPDLTHLWVYLTAPVAGALLAVPCWMIIYSNKDSEPDG